jgi:hypothetical protein
MRVLVCGGRDFSDQGFLNSILDLYHAKLSFSFVIEGGARGADSLARTWSIKNKIAYKEFKADWEFFGRAAGSIRNRLMLEEGKPDFVIAFPGAKGTENMISQAKLKKVPVLKIELPIARS